MTSDFTSTKGIISVMLRDIRARVDDGDYYGPDNLLYCGKCKTPKECLVDHWVPEIMPNGMKNPLIGVEPRYNVRPTPCKCKMDAAMRQKQKADFDEQERRKRINVNICYDVPELSKITFADDDGQDAQATEICKSFIDNFDNVRRDGQGMLFSGGTGGGKTFMAACVANELLDRSFKVRFSNIATLSAKMTENYGDNRNRVLAQLAHCDLVVIDDFGRGQSTKMVIDNANEIMDTIYKAKVPLIITTNLEPAFIATDQSEDNRRIYDRILERCYPVRFNNTNRRRSNDTNWHFVDGQDQRQ